jgi:hypothetical protein
MLSFFWLIGEVIVVLILCLPLPHAVRGLILRGFDAFEVSSNVCNYLLYFTNIRYYNLYLRATYVH